MRLVRDMTGRFAQRPHYDPQELDQICEAILSAFFKPLYGKIPTPITTDDLTKLIERDTSDFDPGADLTVYGPDVEGVTEFRPGGKPRVRIAADLAYDERRENRFRTTLTHEYGHVHLHTHLFGLEPFAGDLLGGSRRGPEQICKRETILSAPQTDWMEWQAGYVCGALLMPRSAMRRLVGAYQEQNNLFGPAAMGSEQARTLIDSVAKTFQVSQDAARVRLIKLDFIAIRARGASLFG